MRIVYCSMAITLAALSLSGRALAAPVETVLYSFTGGSDGATPFAGLISDDSGALYSTTYNGGGSGNCFLGCGTVFKLTPPSKGQTTWTETVLYSFTGGSDGAEPAAGLIADKQGALYGTAPLGGNSNGRYPNGAGTIFRLTPPGKGQTAWTETVLYSFCSQPICGDGYEPEAGLIADKQGALYGTAAAGGSAGNGTVFKLTPPGKGQTAWTETVLHSFAGGSDGANPAAGLIDDKQGALYGTTFGSVNPNVGTVFKLTPPGTGHTAWTETVLCTLFGNSRDGLIADKQGALYGTTFQGPGNGGVFKLTPPAEGQTAWTETELYTFKGGSDGVAPYGSLIFGKQGALYGTARSGGSGGDGTIFKLTPPGKGQTAWTETVLYTFKGGSDGAEPAAGLIADKQGALYGTAAGGGSARNGTVFKVTFP